MKVCSYKHEAHFIFVEEDYGEVDICRIVSVTRSRGFHIV